MGHRVHIGLGSNLGERRANIEEAVRRIGELPGTRLVRSSSLYESEPLGDAKTWFVNAVIELDTELAPDALLKQLLAIEDAMGRRRVKGKKWGSRIIDLDILLYDQDVIEKRSLKIAGAEPADRGRSGKAPRTHTLKIPHPEMHHRRFVLLPLAELAPHVIHPQLGQSVSSLLATLKDDKRVTLLPRG